MKKDGIQTRNRKLSAKSKKKRAGMADFFRNGLDGRWGMGMGMGMGYGSSLPMSGYYHQMGPMSQMTGQSSLYSGMSSMGAWGMAAGTMAAAGTGAIGSPSAHSAFGIGSGTAGTGQAQLPIGTSMNF